MQLEFDTATSSLGVGAGVRLLVEPATFRTLLLPFFLVSFGLSEEPLVQEAHLVTSTLRAVAFRPFTVFLIGTATFENVCVVKILKK